jgi:plasmid stabilization system protein ParE
MARKVRLTRRADTKLDNILIHLNKEFGVTTVDRFLKRLYSFFDIIIEFPQIGTINDREKGIYGFVLEKQVTVFYRFTEKEVVIINFFETRRDPKNKSK